MTNLKLPYNFNDEDLVTYYSIKNIRGYVRKEQIVFILEIPLVKKNTYDYYKLYSSPVLKKKKNPIINYNPKISLPNVERQAIWIHG